jgi:hypothetical protein
MARLIGGLQPECEDARPPFVERLGPGIGWAPDPGGGRSFGEAVSAAVASAAEHAADKARFVAACLAAIGDLPGMGRAAVGGDVP